MLRLTVKNINNWIFVTGVPRSGTTFVGSILSLPKEVDYIHEPFNPMCGIPGIEKWYRYLRPIRETEEDEFYYRLASSIFNYSLTLKNNIPERDSLNQKIIKQLIGSRGPFYLRLAKLNPFHNSAIIKDPIANLLAEYLYLNFKVKPVIIIKHPASFIASLKRVNFWPNPSKIRDQNALIEDYFPTEPDFIRQDWKDPVLSSSSFLAYYLQSSLNSSPKVSRLASDLSRRTKPKSSCYF